MAKNYGKRLRLSKEEEEYFIFVSAVKRLKNITNDDVNESLDALVEKSGSWDPVERQVAMDDMVTMSIVGAVSDIAIAYQKDVCFFLKVF